MSASEPGIRVSELDPDRKRPGPRNVEELLRVLDLEVLDRDTFRGSNPHWSRRFPLFGGQIAAQAARAASMTVPADRAMHSFHGYFLEPARVDEPTVFHVDRDRDGRSFAARHVEARQGDAMVMSVLVSFHTDERGPAFQPDSIVDAVTPPDALPEADIGSLHPAVFDLRLLGAGPPNGPYPGHPHRFWVRTRAPLPDDPMLHACVLTYLSDIGTGLGKLPPVDPPWTGPSLDHTIWFHRPARLDDWVLVELVPRAAQGARGLYLGTASDPQGALVATIAQEHVMRQRPRP